MELTMYWFYYKNLNLKYTQAPVYDEDIRKAYREILGREPDPGGLSHYQNEMRNGMTAQEMRQAIVNSDEAKRIQASQPSLESSQSNEETTTTTTGRFSI